MPTYEYDCTECGARVEFFQSMSEGPKRKCPRCGSPRGLRRRIGAGAGIIFRGSGFFQTDYRSESYKAQAKKEREAAGNGDGGKAAKKEKKAETKSEPKASSSARPSPEPVT